ncbi:Nn.00g031750.m01.CDS01 [Neocucurbitaria sp. VM-36]
MLSRRGCRSSRDFFHALLGIVRADLKEPLKDEARQAILQVATACLQVGDYSPLLMIPRSEADFTHNAPRLFQRCGYNDVLAYGLGPGSGLSDYHSESIITSKVASLKLERIGTVTYVSKSTFPHGSPIASFLHVARIALNFTGPTVSEFVDAVAARLYNLSNDDIADLLADSRKTQSLQRLLERWYNRNPFSRSTQDTQFATDVADLMGISRILPKTYRIVSPLDFMYEHGGTMHNSDPASVIAAQCAVCHKTFVYRAGLHRSPTEIHGSVAYRISGMRYIDMGISSV